MMSKKKIRKRIKCRNNNTPSLTGYLTNTFDLKPSVCMKETHYTLHGKLSWKLFAFITLLVLIIFYTIWCFSTVPKHQDSYSVSTKDGSLLQKSGTNGKRKIFVFFGTRPEFIKLAPLISALKQSDRFIVTTIFTGQHAEIIDKYLRLFNTTVDIWFHNILEKEQSLNKLFAKIMLQADLIQSEENDTWVTQGDTSSALAIATIPFNNKIKVSHIEAGLRSFNVHSPFPEEFNRKTISSIATYNFAPTQTNAKNLLNEGIDPNRIFITGNTVIDAVKFINERRLIKTPSALKSGKFDDLALVTIHRRENLKICNNLYQAISATKCKNCTFIVPLHHNPVSRKCAETICLTDQRFVCVPHLPYEEMQWLLKNAKIVLTDSGGIQEEVTWYNTPTIVLRNSTERKESIEAGTAQIANIQNLSRKIDIMLSQNKKRPEKSLPYGDGNAAAKIVKIFLNYGIDL